MTDHTFYTVAAILVAGNIFALSRADNHHWSWTFLLSTVGGALWPGTLGFSACYFMYRYPRSGG